MHRQHPTLLAAVIAAMTAMVGCDTSLLDPFLDTQGGGGISIDTGTLVLTLRDPVGDQTGAIDVDGMLLVFDKATGAYVIYVLAEPSHPFMGSFRININLYDQDLGTTKQYPSFFSTTMHDFNLSASRTMMVIAGTDPRLMSWGVGNRVFTNSLAGTGNPDDITLFRSSVWCLNGSGTGYLDNEDVIALSSWATPVIIAKASNAGVTVTPLLTEAQCRQIVGI